MRLIHPALRIELRAALYRIGRTGQPMRLTAVPVETAGGTVRVAPEVRPVPDLGAGLSLVLLYTLPDLPSSALAAEVPQDTAAEQLDRELELLNAQLRSTIEQYEASTEGAAGQQRGAAGHERGAALRDRGTGNQPGGIAVDQRGTDHGQPRAQEQGGRAGAREQRHAEPHGRHRDRHGVPRPGSAHHPLHSVGSDPLPSHLHRRGAAAVESAHAIAVSGAGGGCPAGTRAPGARGARGGRQRRQLVPCAHAALPHAGRPHRGRGADLRGHLRTQAGARKHCAAPKTASAP